MANAQLRFEISAQKLRRLENYVATEGSENFLHATFSILDDDNIPNPLLVVYARVENEVYIVPKNEETGLYDIPKEAIKYPGFYLSCRVFSGDNEDISKYTEEVRIDVKGNGSVLKRYFKDDDQYSLEFLSTLYGQHVRNCENIKVMNDSLTSIQEQFTLLADNLNKVGEAIQASFEELGKSLEFVKEIAYPMPIKPVVPVNPSEEVTEPSDEVNGGEVTKPSEEITEDKEEVTEPGESIDDEVVDTTEDVESGEDVGSGDEIKVEEDIEPTDDLT